MRDKKQCGEEEERDIGMEEKRVGWISSKEREKVKEKEREREREQFGRAIKREFIEEK